MRRAALAIVYAAVLAGGLYSACRPAIESRFAMMQTDPGDTALNFYLLEHSRRAVADSSYHHSLWSPAFFHPAPLVFGYSETLLGVAPVYWLLRLFFSPNLAYPLWTMAMHALNFLAFIIVARRLRWPHIDTLLGAWLWAFGIVHIYQAGHQQLIPRFWMPFAVYHAFRFALAPSAKELRAGLIYLFLQTTACVNTGIFLGYGLLAFSFLAASMPHRGLLRLWRAVAADPRGFVLALVIGIGLCVLAVLPILAANLGGNHTRTYEESVFYMPTPVGWITPPPDWRWDATLGSFRTGVNHECYLFGGLGVCLLHLASLAAIFVCRGHARVPAWIAFTCGTTAIALAAMITNFGGGFSAWWLARYIPGGLAVRVISRVYVSVYLFIALGGIPALRLLIERFVKSSTVCTLLMAIFAAAIAWEQTGYTPPSFAIAEFDDRVEPIAELMRGADAAYVQPPAGQIIDAYGHLVAMWAGMRSGVPVINGYSGRFPEDYAIDPHWTDDEIRRWLGPGFHGRVAVVDPDRITVRYLILP